MTGSKAAIRAAMMEELGLDRLDSLPMSDKPRNVDNRRRGDPAPKPARTPKKFRGQGPADNSVAAMWQSAITSGAFNDKDAADVKGLDDLGGGRIYDTRSRAQHAKTQTSKILQNISGLFASKRPVSAIREHSQSTARGTEIHPKSQSSRGRRRRVAPIKAVPPLGDGPIAEFLPSKPTLIGPDVKPAPQPDAQTQVVQRATELDHLFKQLATTVAEPVLTIFKALVLHKHAGGQTPSILFLSASHSPSMGNFDLISTSGVAAHHGLDQWYNYVTGSVVELMPQFKNSNGIISTYALVFHKKMDIPRFLEAIKELKGGKYSHLLAASPAKSIIRPDTEEDSNRMPASEDNETPSKDFDSKHSTETCGDTEVSGNHTEKPQSPALATLVAPLEPPFALGTTTASDDPFDDIRNPSFPEGLSPQQRRHVLEEFLSETFGVPQGEQSSNLGSDTTLGSEVQLMEKIPEKPTDDPEAHDTPEKLSYSRGELLALKAMAAVPPEYLASPEFQPPLKTRRPPPKSTMPDFSEMTKAMAWVQNSTKAPEGSMASHGSGPEEPFVQKEELAQANAPQPAASHELEAQSSALVTACSTAARPKPKGLSSSRWTSGGKEHISSQKRLTGLGYEFEPDSAVGQLHRLAMNAKIASGTKADDILDLFVPIAQQTSLLAASASRAERMNGSKETQTQTNRERSSHSRVDNQASTRATGST
ncbi:hypothetical protein GQ53DRAFT_860292 [Thozetella sp. PMI_491]|nr:hypothetical protein GQ53DRAFT_860292 [Thozetella sp. PMI_491]